MNIFISKLKEDVPNERGEMVLLPDRKQRCTQTCEIMQSTPESYNTTSQEKQGKKKKKTDKKAQELVRGDHKCM